MTRYTPLWQQGGTYPAAVDRGLLSTLWPSVGSTCGPATTVLNTMNVSIPAGVAVVPVTSGGGPAGTELCRWDAAEVATAPAAPPAGQSRIDVVVLQVRDNALDAAGFNDFLFQVIAGAPTSGTPGAPAVPTNAYPICQYTLAGGSANLNGVTLTDRRRRIALPAVGAHIYLGTAQAMPSSAFTTVNFDTVQYDPVGMKSGNGLKLPQTGLYQVNARADMALVPSADDARVLSALYLDGVSIARGADITGGIAANLATTVSALVYGNAGQLLTLSHYHLGGGTQNVTTGPDITYLQAALLGSM
jgi:hypothetical protein